MTDIILCHCQDVLYPQWMDRMNRDRDLFDKLIVMITQTATNRNYTDYLRSNLKRLTLFDNYRHDSPDWRNAAINEALFETRGNKVLFLEQDFLVEDGFFEALLKESEPYQTVGFRDGNRFHPACLLVRQEAIARTRKDFSVDPDVGDHFYKFTQDLENVGSWASLKNFELPKWKHMSGLTQNYRLTSNFYQPQEFYDYLIQSLEYPQPEDWKIFTKQKIEEVKQCLNQI